MKEVSLRFTGALNYLSLATSLARQMCKILVKEKKINQDFANDVELIVSEACTNAIKHGMKESLHQYIEIIFQIDPRKLTILVKDSGKGFDLSKVPPPDFKKLPESGFGIYIIKAKADQLEYFKENDSWNVLKVVKDIQSAASSPIPIYQAS